MYRQLRKLLQETVANYNMIYNGLLNNKICLITGAGKGIGQAVLRQFAMAGASVIYANDIVENSTEETARELEHKYSCTIKTLYFDVSDEKACKDAIMMIKKEQGYLDVLVNNAGVMTDALIGSVTRPLIDDIYKVNIIGSMQLLQLAVKLMSKRQSGSIINLSSIVGITGNPGQLVYSSSKGAIISMTKTAAKELAPRNIRVNAIAPGMIDTDMMRSVGPVHLQKHIDNIPMGRLGRPEEIADVCVFLASDMASYLTGQIIAVDGCVLV